MNSCPTSNGGKQSGSAAQAATPARSARVVAGAARGLSNAHIRSLLCLSKQFAQVELWRGGSLVHCQRKAEFLLTPVANAERFAAFPDNRAAG